MAHYGRKPPVVGSEGIGARSSTCARFDRSIARPSVVGQDRQVVIVTGTTSRRYGAEVARSSPRRPSTTSMARSSVAGPDVPGVPYNHRLEDWFMVSPTTARRHPEARGLLTREGRRNRLAGKTCLITGSTGIAFPLQCSSPPGARIFVTSRPKPIAPDSRPAPGDRGRAAMPLPIWATNRSQRSGRSLPRDVRAARWPAGRGRWQWPAFRRRPAHAERREAWDARLYQRTQPGAGPRRCPASDARSGAVHDGIPRSRCPGVQRAGGRPGPGSVRHTPTPHIKAP
jgi:hypothetical protein